MALDQFLIAPMTQGLQNDVEPWLIPEEAFAELKNAYVWRGRLRKRFGSTFITPSTAPDTGFEQLTSRLRINLGNTDGNGDINSGGTPLPGIIFKVGQMFSIGTELFTVVAAGAGVMITNSATATVMTFNTGTGAYDIQDSLAATACFFYPAEPVMGLMNYEVAAINDEPTFAFDTQFAYSYTAAGWGRLGTQVWAGTNSQLFWGQNYRGATDNVVLLFVTNNNEPDNIHFWDGATWTNFKPPYTSDPTDTINGCRVIAQFKGRLLFLNTYESKAGAAANNFKNRVRYSQVGSPLDADAWFEGKYLSGKGGFLDAPTNEAIISARLLRDRLVVFFERSTWELVDNGNAVRPFVWQRINSELGAESTFSTILFDKALLGIGNVGIHACNGANVERIDEKIPQKVFGFHNGNQGVDRVYGIRDYFAEMAYWAIPGHTSDDIYPSRVLTYNYRNKTWGENDDSITCFGYLQNLSDETWQVAIGTWEDRLDVWNDGQQQTEFRHVLAGNQEGYTFIIDIDEPRNAGVLQITNMVNAAGLVTLTVVDHNLETSDFILIENVIGATGVDGIYQIITFTATTLVINEPGFGGAYTGGGTIARVSNIDIQTKEYNFYQKQGRNLFIPKVGFYVDRTGSGQISVDFSASSSDRSLVRDGATSGALLGTSILETTPYATVPFESSQDRFWHVLYPQAEGETIQIHFYLSNAQMFDEDIALSNFELNAINIYARQVHRY